MVNDRSPVLVHVGENVRRRRQDAGLSQAALAERSGVSRRTIINLEAGDANLGLTAIDRLADALGTTFAVLVAERDAPLTAIREITWQGRSPDSRAELVGAAPSSSETQLWTWSLAAGDRYDAEPDPAGWHEMILVIAGTLRVQREDGASELGPGGSVIYSSAQRYSYLNLGDDTARFVRIVTR
jgi:transcriptional regulator with XRE-family HTH domain